MAHLYTYAFMDIILSIKRKLSNRFSVNVIVLFSDVPSFLPMLLPKLFHYLQVEYSLKLTLLKFISCRLPQTNLLQNFIRFSIRKIQVQKPKVGLISFILFWAVITFWGLMKTTGNAYSVLKYSKESMLLRLLLMYWWRRVRTLNVFIFLRKKLI